MAEISKVLQIGDNIRPESLMKNLYKIDSPYDLTDDIVTFSSLPNHTPSTHAGGMM